MTGLTVLKVGGSLGRRSELTDLCQEIARLGARRPLLVVPGGGKFADPVRAAYDRFHLDETTAHRMALLAMNQYGLLLSAMIPGSQPVTSLLAARPVISAGSVPVLLPASLLEEADPLPHSWTVTSDSIAAWVAQAASGARLILLKSVDGIHLPFSQEGELALVPECEPAELSIAVEVDGFLHTYLASIGLEVWVINGQRPERLAALLERGQAPGTRIRPGRSDKPVMSSLGGVR